MPFFFKMFIKNPAAIMHIFSLKSVKFVKTTKYYGPKSLYDALFSDFLRKNHFSHAHILSKKTYILYKTQCSHAHTLSKKRPFSQKRGALMSYFSISSSKTLSVMPIFGQRTSILFKLDYILGNK